MSFHERPIKPLWALLLGSLFETEASVFGLGGAGAGASFGAG
jgi:hypothetical protein